MAKRPLGASFRAINTFPSLSPAWFLLSLAAAFIPFLFAGCASPGEPVERTAPIPLAVSDLAARQSGNDVVLTFSLPKETTGHNPVSTPPSIEIYRGIYPALSAAASLTTQSPPPLLATIPPAMVNSYTNGGTFRYSDSLTAGDFAAGNSLTVASYIVRARLSPTKDSADSNRANVEIYAAPNPIADLQSQAIQSGIDLTWSAPRATLTGATPAIAGYRIYRANAETPATAAAAAAADMERSNAPGTPNTIAASAAPSASAATPPQPTSPFVQIGDASTDEYRDGDAQKDKTYVYSVRSTIHAGENLLESADSNLATITLRDVFPPSTPTQLIATGVPAEPGLGPHIDLSWAINPETDLAGYNVYRSEQAGGHGTRINAQLLPTPAFRDMNAMPGQSYFYEVTAMDRTGNESPAGPAVEAALPAGSQASP